ncbi:hypothetical protein CI238_06723 [Colletotrichum incanum]|uniref:Uncharacterized protein n=1 Tax=Colletotrichum incanum TaxID=1573173 RepID=A0A162N2K8_COLIC|nr:hypothetical protein CI238_06723 [Colletotrichum incanum]
MCYCGSSVQFYILLYTARVAYWYVATISRIFSRKSTGDISSRAFFLLPVSLPEDRSLTSTVTVPFWTFCFPTTAMMPKPFSRASASFFASGRGLASISTAKPVGQGCLGLLESLTRSCPVRISLISDAHWTTGSVSFRVRIAHWRGLSQKGHLPLYSSISSAIRRSTEPKMARWTMTGATGP